MAAIVDKSDAEKGPGFDVEVELVRLFDKSENTWEALSKSWRLCRRVGTLHRSWSSQRAAQTGG